MKSTFDITPLLLSITVEKVGMFHAKIKKSFVLILVLLISGHACKVNHGPQYWAKTYGGDNEDYAEFIQQTSDGGYIVAGYTESFGADEPEFWIMKLKSTGDVIWQKTYGGGEWDIAHFIQEESDGSYILAGTTGSFGAGGFDAWILKLDGNGNSLWQRTYGGGSSDYAYSIEQTTDGGYIVAGQTVSFGAGKNDLWIFKLTESGIISWQKTYGGSEDDYISSIQKTSDEGYVITGYTESFGTGDQDIWVLKIKSNGDVSWQKTYGRRDHRDYSSSIQQTPDGEYILTGYSYDFLLGEGHIWLSKLSSNGSVLWEKTYEGNEIDYPYSMQQTFDNTGNSTGYIIASHTLNRGHITTNPCDISLIEIDDTGNIMWQKTYRGGLWDNPTFIQQTIDGGYIIAGYTESSGVIGAFDHFSGDALILRLDNNGDIPNCVNISDSNFVAVDTSFTVKDSNCTVQTTDAIINETNILPQETTAEITTICEGDH